MTGLELRGRLIAALIAKFSEPLGCTGPNKPGKKRGPQVMIISTQNNSNAKQFFKDGPSGSRSAVKITFRIVI